MLSSFISSSDTFIAKESDLPIYDLPEVVVKASKTSGLASWYGPGFDGKRTASGSYFNQEEYTVASPSLPFGTRLKITNKINGKSVIVTVTDRGPFALEVKGGRVKPIYPLRPHPTRILDLSKATMVALGGLRKGVIPISINYLTS